MQTDPAVVQPPAPEATAIPQMPIVAPLGLVQRPPQQSRSAPQASPFCTQYEEAAAQRPPLQSFEQHSPLPAQGLPELLHVVLSGTHAPAVHLPPQHWPSAVHAPLSAMHCLFEHAPPMHENVQH